MITVPLVEDGVDLNVLSDALKTNSNVLGIICVPRHSNPSGEVYSDENINELFKIGKQYSEDFLFLFDSEIGTARQTVHASEMVIDCPKCMLHTFNRMHLDHYIKNLDAAVCWLTFFFRFRT